MTHLWKGNAFIVRAWDVEKLHTIPVRKRFDCIEIFHFFSQLYSNKVGLRNFLNLLIIKAKEIWDLISKWLSLVTKISQNLLQKYNHLLYLHCLRLFWKIAISKLKACSKLVFPLERSIFHSSRCYEESSKGSKTSSFLRVYFSCESNMEDEWQLVNLNKGILESKITLIL